MFLNCDYTYRETSKETLKSYQGFRVSHKDKEDKIFMSGDPVKDFSKANSYIAKQIEKTGEYCGMSSDVDQFVFDCGDIFSWYMDANGCEMFDWTDKAEQLDLIYQKIRFKRVAAVQNLLQKLGVSQDTAQRDAAAIFEHCSPESFVALSKHTGNFNT